MVLILELEIGALVVINKTHEEPGKKEERFEMVEVWVPGEYSGSTGRKLDILSQDKGSLLAFEHGCGQLIRVLGRGPGGCSLSPV